MDHYVAGQVELELEMESFEPLVKFELGQVEFSLKKGTRWLEYSLLFESFYLTFRSYSNF